MGRAVRLLLVLALGAWFTIIVPAHERGQIRLPGSPITSGGCCPTAQSCHEAPNPDESPVEGDPVRSCAVCHLVAKLTTPDVLILSLPEPEPLLQEFAGRPVEVPLRSCLDVERTRAPPA